MAPSIITLLPYQPSNIHKAFVSLPHVFVIFRRQPHSYLVQENLSQDILIVRFLNHICLLLVYVARVCAAYDGEATTAASCVSLWSCLDSNWRLCTAIHTCPCKHMFALCDSVLHWPSVPAKRTASPVASHGVTLPATSSPATAPSQEMNLLQFAQLEWSASCQLPQRSIHRVNPMTHDSRGLARPVSSITRCQSVQR